MDRKIFYVTVTLSLLVLSNISAVKNQTYPAVKNPGQYIKEVPNVAYNSIDPATNYDTPGSGLNSLICETLYDYNGSSLTELIPQLAASMPFVSTDGTQINVTLKQGIHFTDGTEFNAWTYKYSIDRVMLISDPNSAAFTLEALRGGKDINNRKDNNITEAIQYLNAGAIKVLNDYEIQFNLDYNYVPFMTAMTFQVGCAVSPKFVVDHTQWGQSAFTPISQAKVDNSSALTVADNATGMVRLDDWFPSLNGNYTKLGLNATLDPAFSGVVPSGVVDPCSCSPAQFWYGERHQVGTGPWKLRSFTNSTIILDKNTAWHGAAKFTANSPDQILIKAVTDGQTRATDLQNGDADESIIDAPYFDQFVNTNGSPKLKTVQVWQKPSLDLTFMGFNLRPGDQLGTGTLNKFSNSSYCWDNQTALTNCGIKGYTHWTQPANYTNPFTALNFRKAFAYAVDYQAYILNTLKGFGLRMQGLIPEGLLGHQSDLIGKGYIPTYNPLAAKALFQQLDWQGTISLVYESGNIFRQAFATQLKTSIESLNIGIHINVIELQWTTFLKILYQLPIFLFGWTPDFADPDDYLTNFIHSTKGYYSARMDYINPALDSMLNQAAAETNTTQRILDYQSLERYIAEENIFLYMEQRITTFMRIYWIQGFEQSGSMNPMRLFTRVQFINKQPLHILNTNPYSSSTSTTSSSSTITTSIYSGLTSSHDTLSVTNGFDMISVIFMFLFMPVFIRKTKLRK